MPHFCPKIPPLPLLIFPLELQLFATQLIVPDPKIPPFALIILVVVISPFDEQFIAVHTILSNEVVVNPEHIHPALFAKDPELPVFICTFCIIIL